MRIIGGTLGGRRFYPPVKNWPTRPTTDISKEGLFNILNNRINFEEIHALDLFGGTGAHSFEMISRGCPMVTYVDKHKPCVEYVYKMAKEFHIEDHLIIIRNDVKKYIQNATEQFEYIFAGPPYPLSWIKKIPSLILSKDLLKKNGLFILETDANHNFKEHPGFQEVRHYGQTHFWFFSH